MHKIINNLKNNTDFVYKRNQNTPRCAFYLNVSINNQDVAAGVYPLMARLFMQGTKSRSAQQLSEELDKYAIEFSVEYKLDYMCFRVVCLNEDFEKALEILTDVIKNTTFEEFDKECVKFDGEIIAELDSPRLKVIDTYYKNIYENHSYGVVKTIILENLKNISKNDIVKAYEYMLENSKKTVVFVGDIEYDNVQRLLNQNLGDLPYSENVLPELRKPQLLEKKEADVIKDDLNQAHILRGWLVESADGKDYPALALLNIILGASGLSSRLFLELRDKKGLTYVVRSSYDIARLCANFSIYIATEPKNIEVSLKGFEEEIEKIKTIPVSEEELENAKSNLLGKWAFLSETNSQQASRIAHYGIMGFGYDFDEKAVERIKKVTVEDIQVCANKYFNEKSVTAVLKP